ncbi:metallo-beta-lactamase superfamily protein [Scopulibacillus darangshiensis]|uniref:Metallo-beta-lactamase superfamily protein n=1 Tax=Scopulibacillus darangshiensis TaxID=442528 RepID=A0A4R2P6I4_9BACL|nr:MBL fold metallo-hydrolase [Scopulibacillus darangshiensis]TCP29405.1 metallo-beta-lactamase superfamily protein [Scopulibacillus darangshiensis]
MQHYVCVTCGTQYPSTQEPPAECTICNEERQYVGPNGQVWTTLEDMRQSGECHNDILHEEEGLYSITTKPSFAIGQTAYLIQGQSFNLLCDCITYIDDTTIEAIKKLGGADAIALSHPHYYSAQVEWAEALDAPIYIHEDDKEWVMRPSDKIKFWSGEVLELSEDLTLHRLGGHFKGGSVVHWDNKKNGTLFTGDIIQVVADRGWVSFMYSYPNSIPLPAEKVEDIANRVKDLTFDRLYGAFHRVIKENANESVQKSAKRYIDAIKGKLFTT